MKLVNEKGKLFGIINIVDLAVILVVVILAGSVVYRMTSDKVNVDGGNLLTQEQNVYVTLWANLVMPEVGENISVGDKLVATGAYTDAEVVYVGSEDAPYVGVNDEGKATYSTHPLWKDVTVIVKQKVNPADVTLKVGGQEARVGYSYILKTQRVETNVKVKDIKYEEELTEDFFNKYNIEK